MQFGPFVSLSLALHNIPEGLAVALVLTNRKISPLRAGETSLWLLLMMVIMMMMMSTDDNDDGAMVMMVMMVILTMLPVLQPLLLLSLMRLHLCCQVYIVTLPLI